MADLTVPLTQKLASLQYPHTPLIVYKAWAEMLHRYFVGALSIFIVIIITIILSKKTLRFKSNVIMAFSFNCTIKLSKLCWGSGR